MNTESAPTLHPSSTPSLASRHLSGAPDWIAVGAALPRKFATAPIHLIPSEKLPRAEALHELFPNAERIFAVDFYVDGAERGALLPNGAGHRVDRKIINIDHHAPHPRWERHVSSGNLACRWVELHGAANPTSDVIVINHTDCDSMLASLIVAGALPPHARFEQAVLDADHRGTPNRLSDILQALSSSRDPHAAVRAISSELRGEAPDPGTQAALDELQEKRLLARELARSATIFENGVAFVRCHTYIDSDLFLPELTEAAAIVISCRSRKYPDLELTRLRLGNAAPEGLSLHRLGVSDLDPYFGGRFNAGSNKRGLERAMRDGETPVVVPSEAHFRSLVERISNATGNPPCG